MLDLLVVIWLMLKWLKILFAAVKSWYRQPPRYVKDQKRKEKATFAQRKVSTTKHDRIYKSGHKTSQTQAVERVVHEKLVPENTLNSDTDNIEKKDEHFHPKTLIKGPKFQRRDDSSLTSGSNDSKSKSIPLNDQLAVSRVWPDEQEILDKSVDGVKRLTEGPDVSRTDQSWGPYYDGSGEDERPFDSQFDSDLLLNKAELDSKFELKSVSRDTGDKTGDDLITFKNGKSDFDVGKRYQVNEQSEELERLYDRENVGKEVADAICVKPERIDIEFSSSHNTNIEDAEPLKVGWSCEQNVTFKESMEGSTQKIKLHEENTEELQYAYKVKGHSEATDLRKEKAAVKEATMDTNDLTEEFQKVTTSHIQLKSDEDLLNVDTNGNSEELISNAEETDHWSETSLTSNGHFETEQSTKLKCLVEIKEKRTVDIASENFMELSPESPKVRKSDVSKVSELLLDQTTDSTDSVAVHILADYSKEYMTDQSGQSVSKDRKSVDMKTKTADNETADVVERHNTLHANIDKDVVESIPSMPASLETRYYQTNGNFVASVDVASRNFNSDLDTMFTKYQNKTVGESVPSYQTMSYSRVAPKLEVVTSTMQQQMAASSVLSRIPYSSSFALTVDSAAKDSRRRHRSQPLSSQETKIDTRRPSLELFTSSYDYPPQKDYKMYAEPRTFNSRRNNVFSGNNEQTWSYWQPSLPNIWRDISYAYGTYQTETKSDVTRPVSGLSEQFISESRGRRWVTDDSSSRSNSDSFRTLSDNKLVTYERTSLGEVKPDISKATTQHQSCEDASHWRDAALLRKEKQVSDVVVPGQPEDITAKEALLLWSRRTTDSYPGVQVRNFTTSWRDGKAFLSIIHRNRPDLVDFRRVQTQTARQNLEQAFSTAEREFGVTRLLDPEDVDVPEPDEKSVITYVSSLYDVFPEVPTVEQSLMDNERQLKIDEYKDMTSSLVSWLQDIIMMMSQRNFPSTLIEMKSLLADLNRFKIEDVPPRLEMRKKALRLFDEIQSTGAAHLVPEDELYPDNVNRLWNRYEHVQQERDMAIQAEIVRLERLQRLAEKIHRESKHSEDSLNDIERRIRDEERRVEILHPYEAKRNCDALERAMKTIEDTVRSLLRDAQALQDARYTNSDQMYRRVATLQSRVSQLRTELYSNVIQKLISKSYVEEGITTTRRREVVTEVRLVESNPAFRHVQYCLNWIEAKQNAIEGPDLGTDAASIQASIEQHQEDHREIQAFRQEIENCKRDFMTLSPDEQELYTEWLSKVEVAFSLLNNTSSRRLKGLESLQEFIQAATQELMWLNEKEEIEVTRDWSSRHLNVPTVEEFYKNLIQEMKVREAQFNSVQDRGNSMVLDRHPQSKTIEVYMSEMQSQWSWLLQLSVCLDAHVKHASAYYQFFEEASECEQWMSRQSDSISSRYTDENQSIDTLNQLLKELQELSAQIADYERQVSSLTIRSREIIPLKQRGQPVFSELRCRCLCIYKQPPLVLQKGEEITLLDNSQKIRWRVRTSSGQEDLIPSVCILIPPPNYEAIEFADRLKIQMDHLQSLLKMRQRKLRHNMVNATINLIRNWDLQQFQSLDPARREALLRALNEDAAKLIAEVGEGDREMRQLRDRLNECNQNFQRLAEAVSEEERNKTRGPNKEFLQKLDSVSYQLSSLDQDLQLRVQQPLPHDRHSLDIAKQQQGDWERSLQNQEGPVEQVRLTYNKLGMHSPQAESKIEFINGKWDQMITLGNTYAERMKVLDGALSKLDNLRHFLADQEVILGSQDSMSSEPRVLKSQRNEIQNIQQAIEQRQSVIDSLTTDIGDLRSLVEKSRPGVARHHDLEVLEKDVNNIMVRWGNVKEQVNERLTSLTDGVDSLTQYTNGLSEEQDFVAETQAKIQSEPPLSPNLDKTKKLVQPTLGLYNSLREHQHQIEAVNRHGGQFIREAKQLADSFDKLNQDLRNEMNWLSDVEQLLKDDQPVNEEAYKAQCQREAMKALQEDVLKHQQPIRSLVYQSEQLVEHHQEELTPEQVAELQHLESSIKTSFGKVQKTCDSRVKHLSAATEELTKFEDELKKFDTWSEATDKELDRQMEEVQKSDNIRRVTELHKEMTSDILDHGADLRYLSFAVQKYMEEAKLHKLELEAYKADRLKPSRLSRTSWIAMDNKEVEVVKDKQKDAESRYKDLKSRCNSFGEKLSLLTNKQKEFNDNTWGMLSWLTDAEEKLSMTRQEASAPEPEALRDHLEKMKGIANDAITHKNNMAELEKSAKDVIQAMSDLGVSGDQVEKIRDIITDISGRHDIVLEEINEKANALQTAVTKSQDVQDAVEQLLTWLKETDRKLEQLKPVSLNQDKLNEQAQKLNIVETDIESHKPSIDSVRQAASELIKTCDLDMAKTLESKISDLGSKFFNAQKKCRTRAKEVQDVSEKLNKFNKQLESCKTWVGNNSDTLQSLELSKMPVGQLKIKVDAINLEKGRQLQAMEKLQALGHELLEDSRTGDPAAVKMALGDLEKMWTKFDECLAERESEASVKESRGNEYEAIKNHVVAWLARMEGDVNAFEPVAVDMDIVAKQIEVLQPLLEEYYEFSPKIDELNDVGNAYDAIQSGDSRPKSPMRFRGRRIPSSVLSPRLRSPSPTTGSFSFPQTSDISPMSISSDSSGVGSRKSSSDYLQLDDLSETQQDILDMNQRYEMLEERLLDRQQELQGMLETVKSFLQDLSDIFSWLDLKERDLEGNVAIATSEKEARKRLKEHEHEHAELLSKDSTVEEIKKKGQDLIKRKRGVPGIDMVQQQLIELDDKWQGVKAASNEQRKLHEDIVSDLRTYKDAGVHLQKWIAQKEKMVAVLGPVATEPSMIKNQLEQVKVLHEELRGQEPLYDKFIQAGNAVHDKCVPESKDAAHISEKMTVISKSWDRLSDRLREREKSLVSVEGLSKEFSDNVSQLGNWVADYMTTVDQLQPVTTNPEKHQEHLREIKELEWELKKQAPVLERAKELAKKLSDNTKDGSTKLELRNKVSNLEKPMAEAEKKLVMRRNEVEKASAEGDKFKGSCQDLLALIDEIKDKQRQMAPVSGDADVLKDQAQHNKEILKDLANLAPEIKILTDKAKMFGGESSPAAKALLAQVDTIQKEWEELKETANQREEQLQASTKHAQNFQAQLDKMSLWLQLSEDKLDGLTPEALDSDSVAKKLKEAQALRGDILKLTHQQESLNREGQSLMNTVDSDKGAIKVRLEDINHRWDNLNEGLTERIQSLEDLSGRLTEFGTYNEDLNSSLKKLEDKLDAHFNLGSTAKDPKYQDKIANMQEDASALNSQIDYLEGLLSGLDDVDGSAPREHILDLEKSRDRQAALQQQLQELLDDMEAGTQIVDQFQGTIKKAGSKLAEMEAELNHMSPVARDESTLGMQERQIEEFISRLNDIDHILDEVENQYKALQADGYVTAADGLAAQLENLKTMQERIQEQSADRKTEIKDASNAVDTVTDNLRRMRTSIDRAGDELEMHDPIGSDVNAIKRMQDELKEFQRTVLENVSRKVQAATMESQGLIQSAAPGVDTSGLEADQESLMDRWNSLSAKVSERDRNLDNAILQSGKFNDAFMSLMDWLKETEELVGNQKPPSPDFKVAKAQLQEQKFLLKMLDDRYPSVKSVKDSGETLQKNLKPQEKKAIQNQIAQLDKRWEALNSNAQERAKTLENIMGIAQEFQDAREPLISWLDGAEKKFAGLEPSAMDVDGIVNIINALEDIEGDLNSRDGQVKQLAAVAKELQNHCKGDDVKNVQRKIDDVQNRFAELSDKLSDTQEQMEEALPLAKNFNDAHAKFIDWIVKIEPKARTKEAQEPEDQVVQLLESLKEIEPVLEVMTNDGGQLAELVPGDAGFKVEDTIAKDMKRFEGVNDAIQKKAEKFRSAKQKSVEVMGTIDDLLEWFEEAEGKLTTARPISCEPKKLQSQLSDQKAMNEDINAQKAKARDMIAAGKRLLRESSMEDEGAFNDKMDTLKQQSDAVAKLCSDRMVQLEQAMPLSKTFLEAHQDLLAWFTEVEPAIAELEVMSINQDTVKKQQDKVKVLKQDIQDNKPLVDKLNKTGTALTKLYLSEDDLDLVKSTVDDDNRRVEDIRRATRDRSMSIDEALQQSAEFTDKLENMLDTLTATEEQVTNAEPVSAHPDKIREQIGENNALLEDMQMRLSALESVRNAAEDLIKQASDDQDEAVQDVKAKLRELVKMFEKINDGAQERNAVLEDTLEVSDKFWDELQGLTQQLKALSDTIANQEPPALEPAIIREQQETLEAMRDDIEASQFDLDEVHQTGEQLMSLCGEPDRPEVQKNIDDLDNSLLTITGEFDKRSRTLEEALERSMYFQEELMKTLVWLQKREDRLKEFQPVASNFDTIKDQWNEVKLFKSEVEPKHSDIESLNQKADELVKDSSPDQAVVVKEPMSAVNRRWDGLLDGIGDRQRELQLAMLDVGQFEHAMNELLAWLDKTEQTLDECKPVYGDRKLVEIELAKHKVLQNDIHAHAPSVKSIQEAGQRAVMTEGGKSSARKRKLDDMTRLWNEVQEKSNHRQEELEDALKEAKEFSEQMEKTLVRLGQIEGMLITSRPVGGLPETAKEQLERFMHEQIFSDWEIMQLSNDYYRVGRPICYSPSWVNWLEVYNELQDLEPIVGKLHTDGNKLIRKSQDPSASNIKQNMQLLQQSWEHIKTRSEDRKGKLEQAVAQANSFHGDLNTFIAWLTDTEKILNNMRPVSRVIDHVTEQIKDQKALQKDIQVHREAMIKLDKTGTHLKYFSQKQDVVLIKNLLASVQQRWEKIVSRTAERTRHLERGFKEAKQFNDMMGDMLGWLADAEQLLTSEYTVGNDPAKIKGQIAKHKEFQKSLGAKQPIYDNINRAGRSLKERSPDEDHPIIQDKLKDLKEKWNSVCGKSVDRQRKLEEALLFSGQFNDALEALLDWLAKVEPGLGEDQMVHGDIDTVNNLVEEHKAFQQELGARANNVSFVRKRAKELLEKAEEDTSQQQAQLIELSTMWDRVCKLSVNKQERLQQAQKLADDFQKKAHNLVTWLASAERQLRYKGPLPDDEAGIMKQMEEHKAFEEDFLRQEGTLRETLNIGQDIMKRCHPDAVSTMKHWLSVLKARWEEVSGWSRQRGTRLRDGLANFRRTNALLEELIAWLNGAENKLFNDNAEPIPDDAEIIVGLIKDHQDFQNEMSGKQPEIDQLTKSDRRRTTSMSGEPVSHIPMFKGLSGRRTPVKFGSLRRGHDDGRRTPEPHFKNPRVGALFNKWRQVWLVSMDRHRRLQEALDYLNELERMKNFKFEDWRKRYLTWMHHNKSRIMDFFRRQDRDRDGKVTRAEFIEGIMASRFQTTPMEMEAVANIFDRDGDGFVDYKEFVSALRPDRDPRPETDAEMIQDEVKRQVTKCTCVKQYRIHKIGEGKYRFGDSQKLRLVRILRSTVMVRVGGGWMALDEFLVKNDPCRAKGRTNVELREQFTLASGVSQSMAGFVSKSPSGSSYSGSSTYSGATSPWSTRSPSSAGGPVIRVRERTQYATPWRQNIQKTYKNSPDGEVRQILSSPTPEGSKYSRGKLAPRDQASPRHLQSPGTTGTPASRSSSRASTGSRPFSPTGSENSEISEPEVFTTVQSETRNVGGRNETTRTYQTHVVQTRTVNTPTRMGSSTPTRLSKIPKLTPKKR